MKRGIRITPEALDALRTLQNNYNLTDEGEFSDDEELITHYRDLLDDIFHALRPYFVSKHSVAPSKSRGIQ